MMSEGESRAETMAHEPGGGHRVAGRSPAPSLALLLAALLTLFLAACAGGPYRYESGDTSAFVERSLAQSSGGFDVRAAVLDAAEAEALLGIDVYERGIQPVWLEIRNGEEGRARVAITSVDPKYFPPAEVAWFFKKEFSKEGWRDLENRLIDLALPRRIESGATASGLVFTNRSPGTKAFNLDVFRGTLPPSHEQFTFFLRVPGFVPDYTEVRFQELYAEDELVETTEASLPEVLAGFACCTVNDDGTQPGRPVNIYFVADPLVLLRSLLRAGFAETPSGAGREDPGRIHHLFGRPPDGTFRKPRDGTTDRSELAIWKTPVQVDGNPLWAAQLNHAIGRRFPIGERLFGVRLDPDTVEGRNYVLQTFWYAQALEQWGLSPSGEIVSEDTPVFDFQDNPWFSFDGLDVVIWLSPTPVPMNEARVVEWIDRAHWGEQFEEGAP